MLSLVALVIAGLIDPSPSATDSTPPIAIEGCAAETESATNPNLRVGISFRDLANSAAIKVRFDIFLVDASGDITGRQSATIEGTFSPNTLIEPRRAAVTNTLLTQPEYPDSSAWIVPNHYGSGVTTVHCELNAAKFADGSAYNRPQ